MGYVYTFLIGGAICAIGQLLMDATKLTAPRVLVIFVVAGAVLQGLQLYEPLVELAGSGATVPLPGFGYVLAKGAMEGAREGLLQAVMGGVKAASGGIAVAVSWGYIVSLIFSPKSIVR
ncbi:MAG: stage V sporulation protein AE [Firmicutes bacterium]|nr:stage V sporulation protein AE [Bacillota bacterium]